MYYKTIKTVLWNYDSDILVGHIRRYESTELKQLLSSCGFDVKKFTLMIFYQTYCLIKFVKKE